MMWCCRRCRVLINCSHASVGIPRRCAASDANGITILSKQDLASLSKEARGVRVVRLIENIMCLKIDTSDVSLSGLDPPCSLPNADIDSPV